MSISLSSSLLSWPIYILSYNSYFSSSLWSFFSTSNNSSPLKFSVTSSGASVTGGGGISDFITSNGSSLRSLYSICSLLKATSSMSMVCSILVWDFESLKSIRDLLCSLALALVLSQSSLDQSKSWGKGCQAPCLQYDHDRPKLSHAFLGIDATMSILFRSDTLVSIVLNLLIFIGLNQWFLPDHLVPILPVVCFLGFLGVLEGAENWSVTIVPWYHHILSCNAFIFCLREGKGITFLLHGVKIVDSAVWSLLYVYIPLTVLS